MIAVKGENCQSGQKSKYQTIAYFQETHFKYKDTDRLKAYSNQIKQTSEEGVLTEVKENVKTIKWTLCQELLTIPTVYVFNRASKYLKHQNASIIQH